MDRVLLTGMSGTGKSSVVRELVARGFRAVDTNDGWCEAAPDGRQRWREAAIQQLLSGHHAGLMFIAGCEENQVRFHPQFDVIILLSAPLDVLTTRLATRTTNGYGRGAGELARILQDVRDVEPRLRKMASHEVMTTVPLGEVVDRILALAQTRAPTSQVASSTHR